MQGRVTRFGLGLLLNAAFGMPACAPHKPAGAPGSTAGASVTASQAEHNLLGTLGFDDGVMSPWMTSFTPPASGDAAIENGAMCILVKAPGKNRWDAQLRHREMILRQGHEYTLGLRAWSSRDANVTVKVGMSGPPYTDYWTKAFPLTAEPQAIAGAFEMQQADDASVELAFHVGGAMIKGAEPVEVCFDDVVLSDPQFTPAPRATRARVPAVRVNQLGYLPELAKLAIVVTEATQPQTWKLIDGAGEVVTRGETLPHGADATSGDHVQIIDFSDFRKEAQGLKIAVGDEQSDAFDVQSGLYAALGRDALRFFYHMRSGTPIEMPYVEDPRWAHPAGHRPDLAQCASGTSCDYSLDVTGGWYDAGDQGKYVVNAGFSVWLLQNAYERARVLGRSSPLLLDGAENIPESGNGVPDILDEARWEMEFLLKMQVPPGRPQAGMAHHKMHDLEWTALGTAPHEDTQKRILRPPTTAATLNLAASAAQAARLWMPFDKAFAARCLGAAETAWHAANDNPRSFSPPSDSVGGGAYADQHVEDEFYWAAAELFLTTGKPEYRKSLAESPVDREIGTALLIDGEASASAVTWQHVDVLGKISLALVPRQASQADARDAARSAEGYRKQLRAAADQLLLTASRQGYRFPMRPGPKGNYPWGSNADVLGNMVLLGSAADWAEDTRYASGLVAGMDYLLGRNAMGQSYVTGYGARPLRNPHHRFWAHQANPAYPSPPPGCVSGGPNSEMQDPYVIGAGLRGCPQQKCFVDHIDAYSVNEVAINWNAAMTWAAARLSETAGK